MGDNLKFAELLQCYLKGKTDIGMHNVTQFWYNLIFKIYNLIFYYAFSRQKVKGRII